MKTKRGTNKKESDHNILISKFNCRWLKRLKKNKIEMFNLKNLECQQIFKELTSNTDFLSSVFDNDQDLNSITKKFLKRLNGVIHNSFKKIKISERPNKALEELFEKRNLLRTKSDPESRDALEQVEEELASKCAEDNKEKIKEELSGMKCDEGGINPGKLWNLRKKLFPKSRDPPTAMLDSSGNLVTSEVEIEKIAIEKTQKQTYEK